MNWLKLWELRFRLICVERYGSIIWCELSGKALDANIPANFDKGILWTLRDISKRKELEGRVQERAKEIEIKNEQLKEFAAKDYLTGLLNRSKIDEALEHQVKRAKRHHSTFGIIMVDIDYFKAVNDTYGHQVGDSVLCEFSNLLTETSRETDIVGRWGGEEFLLIIENTTKKNIINFAQKIRTTIETHNFSFVKEKTASFGVTIYQPEDKIHELISRADEALYKAKKSGRNRVEFL